MEFRPLNDSQRRQLLAAVYGHPGSGSVLLMEPPDSGYVNISKDLEEEKAIDTVQSVPSHY
jgi:hypothetical protein